MGGQGHVAVGVEWLLVSSIAAFIYVYGYIQAVSTGHSEVGLRLPRFVGGTACYVAQIIGSLVLMFGQIAGLYVAAVAMIVFFAFMISGAWLLIVGVHQHQRRSAQRAESAKDLTTRDVEGRRGAA
jgi:fatty acid desaturase